MAWLAVVGSHKVNGVAELHSKLVKDMLKDFVEFFGVDKLVLSCLIPNLLLNYRFRFTNVTNGITPRRWLLQCNPALASLITTTLGNESWLKNLTMLEKLVQYADNPDFQKAFYDCKLANKARLGAYIEAHLKLPIRADALFDIHVKRIHEYKRQFMNALGCVYRYIELKKMSASDRKKVVPRVSIFAGKAAPGYYIAKLSTVREIELFSMY